MPEYPHCTFTATPTGGTVQCNSCRVMPEYPRCTYTATPICSSHSSAALYENLCNWTEEFGCVHSGACLFGTDCSIQLNYFSLYTSSEDSCHLIG